MRKSLLIVILLAMALPTLAARRVSVEQLQQILAAQRASNKTDADTAEQIASLELSEQLTVPALDRITAELKPGPKTEQALNLLADASALLSPPAAELPATPKPDIATQRAMFSAAITYVAQTQRHLPDFLATRVTRSFDDSPMVFGSFGYAPLTQLHLVGTFHRQITYRNRQEILDSQTAAGMPKPAPGPAGLATWGEFGPVLAIILTDATKGSVTWDRWEQTTTGQVAVYHYGVPKTASHYHVNYCCATDDLNAVYEATDKPFDYHGTPGYHGDLYLDPATGTIQRVTVEAELSESDIITRAAIAVQYGKVDIGGKSYICPVRSVAISVDRNRPGKTLGGGGLVKRINEVSFTDYHRFGSTSRIFAGPTEGEPNSPAAAAPQPSQASVAEPSPEPTEPQPTAANASIGNANAAEATKPVAAPYSTAASAPPPATVENATTEAEQESVLKEMPVYKTNTREVIVDVVVTKGNGEPVLGLNKQDFAVIEDGRPQKIDFFEEHTAPVNSAAALQPLTTMPPNTYTNVPPAPPGDAVNVLLLDTLNTPMRDQAFVHNKITEFLKNMQPGTRIAIFMLGSKLRFVQGFTSDSSLLLAALNDKKNGRSPARDAASRDRGDTADDAAEVATLQVMQAAPAAIEALRAAQTEVANVAQGERIAMTFDALNYLARYLAGVPGRKNLIWFSSSFPVLVFPTAAQREDLIKQPQTRGYLDRVRETADMLTASKVAVYPVSAEGMMEEHILEADTAGPGAPGGAGHLGGQDNNGSMAPYISGAAERAITMAAMEQLATDTGGKAYFNTNDLSVAAQRAMNDGASYYTVAYSPTNRKMDGRYRHIDLHLTSGHYKLAYRRGYNADDVPALQAETHADPLRPLLKHGLPSATGLLYGVRVVPAAPQPAPDADRAGQNPSVKAPLTRYNVDFFIRWTDVALELTAQNTHKGKIQVAVMAYDHDGNAVNWDGVTQTMNLKSVAYDAIQKSGIPAHLEIDLPSEDVTLVTGVYDWGTGAAGTLEIPLHPASAAPIANSQSPKPD